MTARDGVVELRPLGASQATPLMLPDIEGAAGALVELRGVTRRYGHDVALDDLSATFSPGRLVGRHRAVGIRQVDAARARLAGSTSPTRATC